MRCEAKWQQQAAPGAPRPQGAEGPVLLGRQVVAGPGGRQASPQVVAYRVDPLAVQPGQLSVLRGLPLEKAERKLELLRTGGALARAQPALPTGREWRDALWIVPFAMLCACVFMVAGLSMGHEWSPDRVHSLPPAALRTVIASGACGAAASLVVAGLWTVLMRRAPGCVVWSSLLFGPVCLIVAGLALVSQGATVMGATVMGLLLLALGVLCLACVFGCYGRLIPFTIKVTELVASVMEEHPAMFAVSLLGSFLGLWWSLSCGLGILGLYMAFQSDGDSDGERYVTYFLAALVLFWGTQVVHNFCHVTHCGVFGRWYHQSVDDAARAFVAPSVRVAATTSFGSICLGAFLVASIRASEFVLRVARRDAQEGHNPVCCILLLLLECLVSCIGDLVEFFSEWAYVQCAVRGVSFMEAAKITQSMLTCANMFYITQALLINSVVNLGTLLSGLVGAAAGGSVGLALAGSALAAPGALAGLWSGLLVGGATTGVLSSGAKTLLALWAEHPMPLMRLRPAAHKELEERVMAAMAA